jgi:hypothetical protein
LTDSLAALGATRRATVVRGREKREGWTRRAESFRDRSLSLSLGGVCFTFSRRAGWVKFAISQASM